MIFMTEQLDFENLASHYENTRVPEKPLRDFSWDTPVRPLPFMEHDTDSFQRAVKGFHQRVTLLRCAVNTRHAPTDAQIETFTRYLVDNQRDNRKLHFGHGSWVIPEDTAMPSDAAVDFAFIPSYLAVAWLALVEERYPHIANNVDGFQRAIQRGLRFIFIKNLRGSGYDANRDLLKAVDYLSLGMVFSYIARNRNRYPRLVENVRAVESDIMGHLARVDGFSATDAYSRQKALQLIRGGDKDDSLVCPPVWHQWQLTQTGWAYNRVLEQAPQIAARSVLPKLKENVVAQIQQLREAFLEEKPKYAVFGQRRQITSTPIEIDLSESFESAIDTAISEIGVVPWVNKLTPQGFLKALKSEFQGRLCHELNMLFEHAQEFEQEELVVCVSKIAIRGPESRFFVCARG